MKKALLLTASLTLNFAFSTLCWGHGGVTPAQVITDMKHKQKGPYAAPILRGRNLSEDWLGVTTENYSMDDISGVLLKKVKDDGVGDSEGLEAGDIITGAKMEDKEYSIKNLSELDDFLSTIKNPVDVDFLVIRDGDKTDETVYLVPSMDEVAPEMSGIMGGTNRPQPGMMIDKMMSQTPLANMNTKGKKIRPGMFMEDMMNRSPLGRRNNMVPGHSTQTVNPLDAFTAIKLKEISLYIQHKKELGLSSEQIEDLNELQMDYKKQRIKADADLKIKRLELDEALKKDDIGDLEDAMEGLNNAHEKQNEQIIKLLKEISSIVEKEQRLKFKELMSK